MPFWCPFRLKDPLICFADQGEGIGLVCTQRFSFHEVYTFLLFNFFGKVFSLPTTFTHTHTHDPRPTTSTHYPRPTTSSYTPLRSRLQFAVHVWTAERASSGKWYTARFFATKNCTASRLKVWTSFLYPFAMCLLDFWSRINELLLIFGRLKWCTSTWWKQHGGPKQWTRSSNQLYIPFCRTNKGKYSVSIQS